MRFQYTLNPHTAARFLTILALYFAAQSLLSEYLLENVLSSDASGLIISFIDLLSVNAEETIPTWYATILLFITAVLLTYITWTKHQQNEPRTAYWSGLAAIFFYLSMDEGAVIHEIFSDPVQQSLNTTGYLSFAWLVVFVPLLLVFILLYLRFLFNLPPRIRNLFIAAGALYVGGAVVVEAISANQWYLDDGVSFLYLAIATVEESCEMLGVVLFIYALLVYMETMNYSAVFHFSSTATTVPMRRRPLWAIITLLILVNAAMIGWAWQQPSALTAKSDSNVPFYQEIAQQYGDEGVIILQINEILEANNAAAPPIAASLLTLFDDVLVVVVPAQQLSIAFASPALPFNQTTLAEFLPAKNEGQYIILNRSAVQTIADNQ